MKKFEKPTFQVTEFDAKNNSAKFVIEPLERGFGTTLGNALRRVLLSSLPGAAIYAIEIEGANHEFIALEGIQEDVTGIILNLKNLVVKMDPNDLTTAELKLRIPGPAIVRAGDIEVPYGVTIVNKDLHICTVAQDGQLNLTLHVRTGRGFVTAEANKAQKARISFIATDSNYSPVTKVAYEVEGTRVGHDSSYEKLHLSISTNAAMNPQQALALASKILIEHFSLFTSLDEKAISAEVMTEAKGEVDSRFHHMTIEDLELSVRSYNCLKRAGIQTVDELFQKSEEDMMKVRNLGKKSLKEVKEVLATLGLGFKESAE